MAVPAERKRVAVVGSGVAGLSCAYLLARKHDVAIFEREKAVGMDAHSLDAHGARMDIPLRVFSESYYPNLTNLYNLVGIKYHVADYSFCCLAGGTKQAAAAYFRYVNFLWRGSAFPVPALFHLRQLVKCARLGGAFAHFLKYSPGYLTSSPEVADLSLEDFLGRFGYSPEFGTELLYPMLSVVCTCSYAAVAAYPAAIVVDYFANKYGLSGAQCRAYEGTRDVVDRLTAGVARVVTSATIVKAEAAGATSLAGVACKLRWRDAAGVEHVEEFDEIVLAMQANASAKVLLSPHAPQLDALKRFEYEMKRVVLHTDAALMPPHKRDWSPLNLCITPGEDAASVTVWMNRIDSHLASELSRSVFQTWNPVTEPEASTVIADFSFERPVVNAASVKAIADLQGTQGHGHVRGRARHPARRPAIAPFRHPRRSPPPPPRAQVWFVGAYSRYSMPLLENGVKSAMVVARALGVDTSDVEFDEAAHANQVASRTLIYSLLVLLFAVALTAVHASYHFF